MSAVQYHYGKFPPEILDWEKLIPLVGPANASLARYDGVLSAIPNANILLSPLTTQEAVLSSRIEGTQATMRFESRIFHTNPFVSHKSKNMRHKSVCRYFMRHKVATNLNTTS